MSSTNSNIAERKNSPQVDSTNGQNTGANNNWNSMKSTKENENLKSGDNPGSPKIENLAEPIEPPLTSVLKSFPRQNLFHGKRMKLEANDEYEPIEVPCYSVQDLVHDDCDTFGRYVTSQLRQMSKMQKFLAQRLISEVCFRGQIQSLHMTTVLNTQTTVFQQQQQTVPVFTVRPVQFSNRGTDAFVSHQHSLRSQTNGAAAVPPFQGYANLHQSDHVNYSGAGQNEALP